MTNRLSHASRQRLRVITIGALLLLTLWILISPYGLGRYFQVQKRLAAIGLEIAALEEKNLSLAETNDRLQNDGDYLDEVARKQYGLIKENEIIFDFGRNGR
jgi:cell division protein FtsB